MTWIDIRIRKPTEADSDKNGKVLQLLTDGRTFAFPWDNIDHIIAWMPIPPFKPIEIPDGWRVVDVATERRHSGMKYWRAPLKQWENISSGQRPFSTNVLYITPIEPKYRPFANAAEFRPFAQKEWRYKVDHESTVWPQLVYNDSGYGGDSWAIALSSKIFCDGQPFGMKVGE